jgi:hypothetical protein
MGYTGINAEKIFSTVSVGATGWDARSMRYGSEQSIMAEVYSIF